MALIKKTRRLGLLSCQLNEIESSIDKTQPVPALAVDVLRAGNPV